MKRYIQASTFKAKCLKVMEDVKKTKCSIIITKRNVPVAEIGPVDKKKTPLFGKLKGTIHYKGDLLKPIEDTWNANS